MTSHSQIFMEPLGVALQRAALCLLVLPNRPPPEKFAEFVLENFPGHFELCRQVGIVQPFDVEGGSSSTRPHGSGPSGTRPSGSHVANDIITPSPSPSGSHVAEMKSEVKEEVKEEEVAAQGSNSEGGDGCSCMSGTCFSFGCVARKSSRTYVAKIGRSVTQHQKNAGMVCPRTPLSGMGMCTRCKCGNAECDNRTVARSRFCMKAKTCSSVAWLQEAAGHPTRYVNAFGVHEYGPSWNPPLKAIARMGWLLPDIPPLDYVAFRQLARSMLEEGN
jgi:hypothetical protein